MTHILPQKASTMLDPQKEFIVEGLCEEDLDELEDNIVSFDYSATQKVASDEYSLLNI